MKRALCLFVLLALTTPLLAVQEATLRRQLRALERREGYAAALPLYRELRRLAPQDTSLLHRQIHALAQTGEHGRIVEVLKPWLNDHEDDARAYLALGRAHHALERDDRALKIWRQLLKRQAQDPQLYLQVGEHCRAAGLFEAAIETLEQGRKKLRQDQLYTFELAELHLQRRDYPRAARDYIAYLLQDANRFAQVEYQLQTVAADPLEGPALLDALLDVLEAGDPTHQISRLTATLALEAGRPETGYEILAPLVEDAAPLLFDFAARAQNLGFDETAARAYAHFAAHSSDSPYFYRAVLLQAQSLTRTRQYGRAAKIYRQLARPFPERRETLEALYHLGKLQLEVQGEVKAARATLKSVLNASRINPWQANALILLGECALRLDEFNEAESYVDQLIEGYPQERNRGHYMRAELHYFQNDFAAALKELDALLKDDPRGALGNDALALLMRLEHHQHNTSALETFAQAQLRERQARPDRAARHWKQLLAQGPPALKAQSLLIRARLRTAEGLDVALALYQLLVEQYPYEHYTLEARLGSAALLERRGDFEHALKTYETALLTHAEDVRAPQIRLHIQRLRTALQERREG